VLRNPNDYETFQQFIYNIVMRVLLDGECLVLMVDDAAARPIAMHRVHRNQWQLVVDPDTKAVFYLISENTSSMLPGFEPHYAVPARNVIHFRQYCPRHPLIGESPLAHAAAAVGIITTINASQQAFLSNARRPSGIISTDQQFSSDQLRQLRAAFDEQSKQMAQGGVPILSHGLKFQPMGVSSSDAQLIESLKMSQLSICQVFKVPQQIVGSLENTTVGNHEALIRFWLSTGLGSLLENIERSFEKAFELSNDEYIEFDTQALLRSETKNRFEALSVAITGGLMTPNEARASESLPNVSGGDNIFLQKQNVPVDLLSELAAVDIAAGRAANVSAPVIAPPDITRGEVVDILTKKRVNLK
jgi:HK97 family phage portal protein